MTKDTEDGFQREWAARAYDRSQLAAIAAMQEMMVEYATTAWRPMDIKPPPNVPVLAWIDAGIAVMNLNHMGEWRRDGVPHKPPHAWMPAPKVPPS